MTIRKRQNLLFSFNPELKIQFSQLDRLNLFNLLPETQFGYFYQIPTREGTLNADFIKSNYEQFKEQIYNNIRGNECICFLKSYSNTNIIITLIITL